jgi:uncharacterized protein
MLQVEIEHDEARGQFVAVVDGRKSYLRYTYEPDGTLNLLTTYVHPDIRGRGVGEKLVARALDYAREKGCDVVPTCWFVDTVVARHPEYRDLLVA